MDTTHISSTVTDSERVVNHIARLPFVTCTAFDGSGLGGMVIRLLLIRYLYRRRIFLAVALLFRDVVDINGVVDATLLGGVRVDELGLVGHSNGTIARRTLWESVVEECDHAHAVGAVVCLRSNRRARYRHRLPVVGDIDIALQSLHVSIVVSYLKARKGGLFVAIGDGVVNGVTRLLSLAIDCLDYRNLILGAIVFPLGLAAGEVLVAIGRPRDLVGLFCLGVIERKSSQIFSRNLRIVGHRVGSLRHVVHRELKTGSSLTYAHGAAINLNATRIKFLNTANDIRELQAIKVGVHIYVCGVMQCVVTVGILLVIHLLGTVFNLLLVLNRNGIASAREGVRIVIVLTELRFVCLYIQIEVTREHLSILRIEEGFVGKCDSHGSASDGVLGHLCRTHHDIARIV